MKQKKSKYYVDNPFQSPAVLSFCPGFLGLERGIERAIGKIRVAAYVEIEAFCIENIIKGMEAGILDAAPVWTDVKTFQAKPFHKKIHFIIGGYPCQPFSLAGKRKGKEDPRHLWPYIYKSIAAARPVCCFFENVRGHLGMGYDQVYKDLYSLGYAVEPGIFSAEEVGAPHERERLFILAIRKDFLSDTQQCIRQAGPERSGWPAWTNIGWSSQGAELDDPYYLREGRRLYNLSGTDEAIKKSESELKNECQKPEHAGEKLGNSEITHEWPYTGKDGQIEPGRSGEMANNTGRQPGQQQTRHGGQSAGGRSEEMDNTGGYGSEQEYQIPAGGHSIEHAGKMEYTNSTAQSGNTECKPWQRRCEQSNSFKLIRPGKEMAYTHSAGQQKQRYNRKPDEKSYCRTCYAGADEEISNTISPNDERTGAWPSQAGIAEYSYLHQWPAGPGYPQYDWEHSRTTFTRIALPSAIRKMGQRLWKNYKKILSKDDRTKIEQQKYAAVESGMGISINGYNFREDLLRAAGNSVVEQTAEKAILVLIQKHVKNILLSLK